MKLPTWLTDEIHQAWAGKAPELPQADINDIRCEEDEVSVAFRGRLWHEVTCAEIPIWFSPFRFMPAAANGYYIASAMACVGCLTGVAAENLATALECTLRAETEYPGSKKLSYRQGEVIDHFLQYWRVNGNNYGCDLAELSDEWSNYLQLRREEK